MKTDPAVRADGRCARPGCGKQRKLILGVSRQAGSNAEAIRQAKTDPFCSSNCCRLYHGVAGSTKAEREAVPA